MIYFKYVVIGSVFSMLLASPFKRVEKITVGEGVESTEFGWSVSTSDKYLVVTDRGENALGSVYVYDLDTRNELYQLSASDGEEGDFFGIEVAISGDYAVIGAYADDEYTGSAYVYDLKTGDELYKLTANDGSTYNFFGNSVSISGDYVVIGAHGNELSGSVYVYDLTTGSLLYKLKASDADDLSDFGWSVSISQRYITVGAAFDSGEKGAVYVYELTTGNELYKLTASDGVEGDFFGFSSSVLGEYIVIGALESDDGTGSAYVYDVNTGDQLYKLTASDAEVGDGFGCSVKVSGDHAVIGAYADDELKGSAYLFDLTTGTELYKLTATDGAAFGTFGSSVSVSGDFIAIGAPVDGENGSLSGSVHLFEFAEVVAEKNSYMEAVVDAGLSGEEQLQGADPYNRGVQNAIAYALGIPLTGEMTSAYRQRLPQLHRVSVIEDGQEVEKFSLDFMMPESLPGDAIICICKSNSLSNDWVEIARKQADQSWIGEGVTEGEASECYIPISVESPDCFPDVKKSFLQLEVQITE